MSQQNAQDNARIVNAKFYYEIQLGDTKISLPISLITLIGAVLMFFAFVGMPWVQVLLSFSGLDLFLESTRSLSANAQYGLSVPFAMQIEVYSLLLIPLVALVCGLGNFRLTTGQSASYGSTWRMSVILGVIGLVPYVLLYGDLLNSLLGRYVLQNGFWFSLLGCGIMIGSAIAGSSRASH